MSTSTGTMVRYLLGAAVAFASAGVCFAEETGPSSPAVPQDEESQLRDEQRAIDQAAGNTEPKDRVDTLAKQYDVKRETVQKLRNERQGWGEIEIRLAVAKELAARDPAKYPTTEAALVRVGELRSQGKGWGAIAKENGFKLGPVVSAAKQSRADYWDKHSASNVDRPSPPVKSRPGGVDRPDNKPDRPDIPNRPERGGGNNNRR